MTDAPRPLLDVLDAVLVRARDDQPLEDGCRAILVPKFDGRILGRYLMPRLRHPHFLVRLDAIGTFAWELCDGTLTGHEMAVRLRERFPGLVDPEGRLALFLRMLLAQGHARSV